MNYLIPCTNPSILGDSVPILIRDSIRRYGIIKSFQLGLVAPQQREHPRVKFLVTSSRLMKEQADHAGVLARRVAKIAFDRASGKTVKAH